MGAPSSAAQSASRLVCALQLDHVCRLRQVHDYTQDFISGFNVTMRRLHLAAHRSGGMRKRAR
jgi:hypothetical protein